MSGIILLGVFCLVYKYLILPGSYRGRFPEEAAQIDEIEAKAILDNLEKEKSK
ncbi:MAG: hypothetical protein ACLTBR_03245 [Anaerostipes sp.]|uniref:hypothetical protein n=1 Tax=Anaerostipes sp. TaxID=1872530 RepID=UPI003992EA95